MSGAQETAADIVIIDTPVGKGLRATRAFTAGEKVIRFNGALDHAGRSMYTVQLGPNVHLMPSSPSKYANHSCCPNLGISQTDSLQLIALHDLHAGEELTFDYAMTEERLRERVKCACGTSACRGIITGYAELSDEQRRALASACAPYLRGLYGPAAAVHQ